MPAPAFNPNAAYSPAAAPAFNPNAAYEAQPAGPDTTTIEGAKQWREAHAQPASSGSYEQALFNPLGSGAAAYPKPVEAVLQAGGRAMQTALSPVMHPLETLRGMAQTVAHPQMYDPGNPVFQRAQEFAEEYHKDPKLAIANLIGDVAGTVEGGRLTGAAVERAAPAVSEAAKAAAGGAKQYMRPASSPAVVAAPETAARELMKAVGPNSAAADQFIESAQAQVPNIVEYAKRTGNPLNTRLEFAKAAEGAGEEAYQHFRKNVLDPVANKEVGVGAGYGGKTVGEGHRATLGDIDRRLAQINKELSPAYRQRNVGVVGSKLASEADLQAEAAGLRQILYRELAKSSGLPEEDIAAMRQRYGQMQQLARDTHEAVTQHELAVGKAKESPGVPGSKGEILSRAAQKAAGGPTAIADRMFQKAIRGFPGEASPLKTIAPPDVEKVMRDPGWKAAGIDKAAVERLGANVAKLPEEERKAVLGALEKRLDARKASQASRAEAARAQRAKNIAAHPRLPENRPQ